MKKRWISLLLALCLLGGPALASCQAPSPNPEEDAPTVSQKEARIEELAQNIEKLPSGQESLSLSGDGLSTAAAASAHTGDAAIAPLAVRTGRATYRNTASTDGMQKMEITTPSAEDDYHSAYYSSNSDIMEMDDLVLGLKECKDGVLRDVRQYNIWVNATPSPIDGLTHRYRVCYDYRTDKLTIEEIEVTDGSFKEGDAGAAYSRLQSAYDGSGNILIDYYRVSYDGEGRLLGETTLHYQQGVTYTIQTTSYTYGMDPDAPNIFSSDWDRRTDDFLFESVMTEGGKQTALVHFAAAHRQAGDSWELVGAFPYQITTICQADAYSVVYQGIRQVEGDAMHYDIRFYDAQEQWIATLSCLAERYNIVTGNYIDTSVEISAQYLSGYNAFYKDPAVEDGGIYCVAGGEIVVPWCGSDIPTYESWYFARRFDWYDVTTGEQAYVPCAVFLMDITEDSDSVYDICRQRLEKVGLSLKDGWLQEAINTAFATRVSVLQSLTIFHYRDYPHIDHDRFLAVASRYKAKTVSCDTIYGYAAEACVGYFEQVKEGDDLRSIQLEDTVHIQVSQDGTITATGLSITVERRQILVQGQTYRPGLYLTNGLHLIELGSLSCVYADAPMTFSGTVQGTYQPGMLEYGRTYTLLAMMTEGEENTGERFSPDLALDIAPFSPITITTTYDAGEETCTITCQGGQVTILAAWETQDES